MNAKCKIVVLDLISSLYLIDTLKKSFTLKDWCGDRYKSPW